MGVDKKAILQKYLHMYGDPVLRILTNWILTKVGT